LSLEPEAEKSIRTAGDVELQKLGVVPQTVFLKSRASDVTPRSSRLVSSRRSTLGTSSRTLTVGTPRTSRAPSVDHGLGGAPFDDLRRRLVTINASASSLSLGSAARDHRPSVSQHQFSSSQPTGLGVASIPSTDRPGSPTDSVVSNTNSSSLRPLHRLQVGSTDGQKAAAAVGSSKTNATGLLEAPSKIRSDGSPERSGRCSPLSLAGTIRGVHRHRVPSLLSISTYGTVHRFYSNLYH
jgi:phosphoinositide-3-kinase regulatory subunit 4